MFDSGITATDLVTAIRNEVDAAPDIPVDAYYGWLDEAEQLLYSEIIREMACSEQAGAGEQKIQCSALRHETEADAPRFEDIYAVYADDVQLFHTSANTGVIFPDSYWKDGDSIAWLVEEKPQKIRIYYFVRPVLKAKTPSKTVKLPPEWVCIIRAKLRGEAYKLVNEDVTAAKWLNDYNILLEQFRQYMALRNPEVGA